MPEASTSKTQVATGISGSDGRQRKLQPTWSCGLPRLARQPKFYANARPGSAWDAVTNALSGFMSLAGGATKSSCNLPPGLAFQSLPTESGSPCSAQSPGSWSSVLDCSFYCSTLREDGEVCVPRLQQQHTLVSQPRAGRCEMHSENAGAGRSGLAEHSIFVIPVLITPS